MTYDEAFESARLACEALKRLLVPGPERDQAFVVLEALTAIEARITELEEERDLKQMQLNDWILQDSKHQRHIAELEAKVWDFESGEAWYRIKREKAELEEELDERVGEMDEEIRNLLQLLKWAMGFVSPEAGGVSQYRDACAALGEDR